MDRQTFKLNLRPRWITGLVENVQEHFRRESGVEYPRQVVEKSLEQWLETRFDQALEGLGEAITSPHMQESRDFRRILEQNAVEKHSLGREDRATAAVPAGSSSRITPARDPEPTIFTGKRPYDPARLGAMVAYLIGKGQDIYKTNLNKLLFYSDMTAYFLRGQGISGATYVNMPFGPVPDHIEAVIDTLVSSGAVSKREVPEVGKNAVRFELTGEGVASELSEEDKRVLDWVIGEYGNMGAGELSELSHKERAYRDTRPLEPIAYEYAKFLRNLPASESKESEQ